MKYQYFTQCCILVFSHLSDNANVPTSKMEQHWISEHAILTVQSVAFQRKEKNEIKKRSYVKKTSSKTIEMSLEHRSLNN